MKNGTARNGSTTAVSVTMKRRYSCNDANPCMQGFYAAGLLDLDAGGRDDFLPLLDFTRDLLGECVGHISARLGAELEHLLLHVGLLEHRAHCLVQRVDHRLRRARGREQSEPA